jgi:hypothetical protein
MFIFVSIAQTLNNLSYKIIQKTYPSDKNSVLTKGGKAREFERLSIG